ncbi:MAG: ribonucleoside triphosphate reductase [Candidatus Aenigmarchaeota archaeon ex4484_224]|nr:MAG: ribonucleoside triphosphate reductase [Candidatus Aenigmarchaeota archaeon ex4484_224]
MQEIEKIKKRDGRVVPFDKRKITIAVLKAMKAVGEGDKKVAETIANEVVISLKRSGKAIPTVEEVQDLVEEALMKKGFYKVAKAYILYRALHNQIRELVDGYLYKKTWLVKENANMTFSLQGLNTHIFSQVVREYWLHRIYLKRNPEIAKAHINGDFHLHNLQILGPYCVGWDLRDLLLTGFTGVRGKITSKPAKHFRVALLQVVNFLYTLQGEAAGAQAFSNFDTFLAPFIRYDKLSYRDVKQALQEFMFNMNVPTRVGFQTPFTNITLDLKIPGFMKNEPVIVGGKIRNEVYGDFQEEMNIFNEALAEVMLEGDGIGRVFTFPIPTINITKDFDWKSEVTKKVFETSAKYGIPYFANFVNSDMKPEDVRSMCCRLRIDKRELRKRGGGLFGANPLTGSIGVVTINMPRIGYLSKDEDEFFERLSNLMNLAKESLEIKRKVLEEFTERGLYPYSKFYLRSIKQTFGEYWKNHFSTIGLIGMNEACLNFLGCSIGEKEGHKFAIKVLDFMRSKLIEFQEETENMYNLEATPAEGTSYRLARIDKSKYSDIIVANEKDVKEKKAAPYYTNSTWLPVYYTDDLWELLRHQDPLQTRYTGGTVVHIWLGERVTAEGVMALVRKVFENFRLPYISITPTFSVCPVHGYIAGEYPKCPICGKRTEVYSRVVGYLRPVDQYNPGKQAEFKQRKMFDKAFVSS